MQPEPLSAEGVRALVALSMRYPHPATLKRWLKGGRDPVRALDLLRRSEARRGPSGGTVGEAEVDRAMGILERRRIDVITATGPRFPEALRNLPVPPALLFVRGDVTLLSGPAIAVVGTRRASAYGRDVARWLGASLGREGLVVVSGMARGIDTEAHEGCLEADGPTVAVVGTGLDSAYPPENADLMERIAGTGCVVSEFPPMTAPLRRNFPRRNRMISGLAGAVVVVEAPKRSGALITAGFALDQGKSVLAVPGSIWAEQGRGSLGLLRDGAAPVLEIRDVTDVVGWTGRSGGSPGTVPPGSPSAGVPGELPADALDYTFRNIDEISSRSGLPPAELLGKLLILEMSGRVEQSPGKFFRLRRR